MRRLRLCWIYLVLASALPAPGQAPQPQVPDNTLNSTDTIGLPPSSSKEGTSEVINLNNGALNFLLPAVTLPQRAGAAPLELGFTYDSNQINFVQSVSVSLDQSTDQLGTYELQDWFAYSIDSDQTTYFGSPLDLNVPRLSATREYEGDWEYILNGGLVSYGSYYCLTNVVFHDWKGSAHVFPNAVFACENAESDYTPIAPSITIDNSNDNQFYHLDVSSTSDYVVYGPDGTTYHFANPCANADGDCSLSGADLDMPMTSSVDRFGNTMTFTLGSPGNPDVLTDTLGREITISSDYSTDNMTISYKDPNGVQQTVSVASYTDTIPQSSGYDVGPYLQSNSCDLNTSSGDPTLGEPQYSLSVSSEPDGWMPPAEGPSREFSGLSITYSSTGQSYKLLFDSFGHLMKITYPEGGYHRYDYALYLQPPNAQGPVTCSMPVAEVAHRYECASSSASCAQESVTTYSPYDISSAVPTDPCTNTSANTTPDSTPWIAQNIRYMPNDEMMVQEADGSITLHCFKMPMNLANPGELTDLETDTYQYSAAGTLLRLKHQDYAPVIEGGQTRTDLGAGYPFPTKVTTTLEDASPALSSYTTISYDTVPSNIDPDWSSTYDQELPQVRYVDNPVQTDDYGYDGTHLRSTTQSWYYRGNLVHAPLSTQVSDPVSGAESAKSIGYDSNGCVHSYTLSGTNVPSALVWTYTPDAWCRPTAIQDPAGHTTSYGYSDKWVDSSCAPSGNSQSYLTSVTNALQQETTYSYYSCSGQLGLSIDPNNVNVSLNYDAAQRIKERKVTLDNATAGDVNVDYVDGPGSTITRTISASPDPDIMTQYSLDGLGRVIDVETDPSDPSGGTHVTTYYNPQGEVQAVTNPYRATSDPTYGITSYLYDALGRKTYQCQPDDDGGNTVNCAHKSSYLLWVYSGNQTTFYDEDGSAWNRKVDALGRLTNVIEPGSLQTNYTYDAFGNLLTVNQLGQSGDAARTERQFSYDGLSRLIQSFNGETGSIGYSYLTGGSNCASDITLPCSKTDARGITTYYGYDSLNRLVAKTYSSNAPAGSLSSCYHFDTATNGIGKLGSEWTQAGSCPQSPPAAPGYQSLRVIGAYDAMGRVLTENQCVLGFCTNMPSQPPANCVSQSSLDGLSYCYDLAGNLTAYSNGLDASTFPQQSIPISQTFDGAGRLASVGIPSALSTPWIGSQLPACLLNAQSPSTSASPWCMQTLQQPAYAPFGGLQNWTLGGGSLSGIKTYDNRLRVTGETTTQQ